MYYLSRLSSRDIFIDIDEADFNSIIFHMLKNSRFSRKKEAFKEILAREGVGTTAIGYNIAVPHCKLRNFRGFYMKFAIFKKRLGYIAPNETEVRFVFVVVGSQEDPKYYLGSISHILDVIKEEDVRSELLNAVDKRDIKRIFNKYENRALERRVGAWK